MSCLRTSAVVVSALALCLASPALKAHDGDDNTPTHVTVAFGTGNNNAQPGNTPNHHVLPNEIKVRISKARRLNGDVVTVPATVNFIVSGFHWIWVYRPGVPLQEVVDHIPNALFVNYEVVTLGVSNVYAKGIFPGTPTATPPFSDAMPFPFSGAQNRTDSIAFSTPGKYLVICNVAPHLVDGMYAWVRVVDDDDDHDGHHDDHHDDHEGHGHH
jgi:hypothetical protein